MLIHIFHKSGCFLSVLDRRMNEMNENRKCDGKCGTSYVPHIYAVCTLHTTKYYPNNKPTNSRTQTKLKHFHSCSVAQTMFTIIHIPTREREKRRKRKRATEKKTKTFIVRINYLLKPNGNGKSNIDAMRYVTQLYEAMYILYIQQREEEEKNPEYILNLYTNRQ